MTIVIWIILKQLVDNYLTIYLETEHVNLSINNKYIKSQGI